MLQKPHVLIACFGIAFCVSHFWPDQAKHESLKLPRNAEHKSSEQAIAPTTADIITNRSLIDAAKKTIKLSPEERESLRFAGWAKREPEAAFAAALEQEDADLCLTVITSIAEFDPHLALELADNSEELLIGTFRAWPRHDLEGATDTLIAITRRIKSDPNIDWGVVSAVQVSAKDLTSRWPEGDTSSLIRFAASVYLDGFFGTQSDLTELIRSQSVVEIDFLNDISDAAERSIASAYVAQVAPIGLGIEALELVAPEFRAHSISIIANKISVNDPHAALEFLRIHEASLSSPADPGSLHYGFSMGELDERFEKGLANGEITAEEFGRLPMLLRSELNDVPMVERASWLNTLPDAAPAQSLAYSEIANWAKEDATEVSTWLIELEPSGIRDHSIAGLVNAIAAEDPESATTWASQIGDPALRERFLRVAIRQWKKDDPATATAALPYFNLSELATESLLKE